MMRAFNGGRVLMGVALLASCSRLSGKKTDSNEVTPQPATSAPARPSPSAFASSDEVKKVINPLNEPAYSGPAGAVRGQVTISGDVAPLRAEQVAIIPEECASAREFFGPAFREGVGRSVADVLVAVTGYTGYVAEKSTTKKVVAQKCAWNRRTIAMTFGQALEVHTEEKAGYVPVLLGAPSQVQLVALPGAPSISIPPHPGHFVLSDSIKVFMNADVVVLKYPTHAVTGLDGRFEISGIPAGKVTVSAFLPASGQSVEKEVEIKANATLDVNFVLPFDVKAYQEQRAQDEKALVKPAKPEAKP